MEAKDTSSDAVLDNLMRDDIVGDLAQDQVHVETQQNDTMVGPTPIKTPLASRPTNRATPGSSGSLTMYERSMIQKEERERKMKTLQEKLMVDCTFTPSRSQGQGRNSSNHSVVSSIGAGPQSVGTADMSVFSRLYHTETVASRAARYQGGTRSNGTPGWNTPRSVRSMPGRVFYSTPVSRSGSVPSSPRLEELYKFGEEKLRSRQLSDEEEAKLVRQRLEEQELKKSNVYTFHPQTKWNLAAERRRKAQREAEMAASQASRATPKMKKAVSYEHELYHAAQEETELEQCTFTPKTCWNLIEERRKQAMLSPSADSELHDITPRSERERMERDRKYEEPELDECTFFPKTNWNSNGSISVVSKIRFAAQPSEDDFVRLKRPARKSARPQTPPVSEPEETRVKLVSTDKFKEESGKNSKPPAVVRQNMVREIVTPKTPEWKKKHRKIGQKGNESNVVAAGKGTVDSRKRGHTVIKSQGVDVKDAPKIDLDDGMIDTPSDAPAADTAHIQQQKMFAEQAVKIRLEQKRRQEMQAEAERHEEEREQAATLAATETQQQPTTSPSKDGLGHDTEPRAIDQATTRSFQQQVDTPAPPTDTSMTDTEAASDEPLPKSKAKKWYDRMMKRGKKGDEGIAATNEDSTVMSEEDERLRLENEGKAAEAKRLAEEERLRLAAEAKRVADEEAARLKAKEEARLAAEAKRLADEEAARLKAQEEAKLTAEAKRLEEEQSKLAEEERLAVEAKRLADEEAARLKAKEEARLAAEAKRLEEEQARVAEEERLAAAAAQAAELKRLEEEQARLAEEDKLAAAEAQAAEAQAAELQRLEEEQARLAEEERLAAAAAQAAELRRLEEEQARLAEEERLAAAAAQAAELQRLEDEQARLAEEERLAAEEQTRLIEEERLAAEFKRLEEEAAAAAALEAQTLAEEKSKAEAEARAANEVAAEFQKLAEEEERLKRSEEAARLKAERDIKATADADRLAEEVILQATKDTKAAANATVAAGSETSSLAASSDDDEVDAILESLSTDGSTDEDEGLAQTEDSKPKKKVKSDRAKKWKDRLSKKKAKGKKQRDAPSDAATVGVDSTDAYPKVLYDDGDQSDGKKLPEIGSI
ncbi:MAG: hypothetical protein SGARI_000098 [Bacillariaceae sp.]